MFILMGMQHVLHQGEIGCFLVINVVIWESINFLQCSVFLCQFVHWVVVEVVTFIDSCLLFNVTHIYTNITRLCCSIYTKLWLLYNQLNSFPPPNTKNDYFYCALHSFKFIDPSACVQPYAHHQTRPNFK